jgi:hypothetical protein
MNASATSLFVLVSSLLLAGCATQRELIERRIGEKAAFFAELEPEKQQRLRDGQIAAGDARDAAWIVYGEPDRIFQKVTGSSTNELWSYISYDASTLDAPRPVYHPVKACSGRTYWRRSTVWSTDVYHHPYEYLRIEFENGRVLSFESEQP